MAEEKGKGIVSKMLKIRKKKKKPGFKRQEGYRHVKLKDTWRRPRGRHSKLRKGKRARGKKPGVGYMSPPQVRGLTKSGLKPVYVSNIKELSGIDPKTDVAVIRSSVGKRKRSELILEAEKKEIELLNAYKFKPKG